MKRVLVTGGSGFFGGYLKRKLLDSGLECVNVDLVKDEDTHPLLTSVQGDICDRTLMSDLYAKHKFDAVYHIAAMLAHGVSDEKRLWSSNVDGTEVVAKLAKEHGVQNLVFTSTNCLWAKGFGRPVLETDTPEPIETYGRSKWEAEKILQSFNGSFRSVIIRCPTIIDSGRMGLLAILFQFIDEGRRVWLVGGGHNKYQFIYAQDLVNACVKAASYDGSDLFNVGSDDVKSLRDVYDYVIKKANTGARTSSLPKGLTLTGMKLMYKLKLSPLGPYHYKMIAEDFAFDTTRIKKHLDWKPTLTNEEMLYRAYAYYREHGAALAKRDDISAHKKPANMGVIKVLKWIS